MAAHEMDPERDFGKIEQEPEAEPLESQEDLHWEAAKAMATFQGGGGTYMRGKDGVKRRLGDQPPPRGFTVLEPVYETKKCKWTGEREWTGEGYMHSLDDQYTAHHRDEAYTNGWLAFHNDGKCNYKRGSLNREAWEAGYAHAKRDGKQAQADAYREKVYAEIGEPSEFFPAVRDWLDRSGFSQGELAEKIDVSRATLNRWLNGRVEPTPEKMRELGELIDTLEDAERPERERLRPLEGLAQAVQEAREKIEQPKKAPKKKTRRRRRRTPEREIFADGWRGFYERRRVPLQYSPDSRSREVWNAGYSFAELGGVNPENDVHREAVFFDVAEPYRDFLTLFGSGSESQAA